MKKKIKGKTKIAKAKNKDIVKKTMMFADIMEYPEAVEVLFKSGMHCVGCSMASFETIEQGCLSHGLNPNKIVDEINKKLSKKLNKTKGKGKKK